MISLQRTRSFLAAVAVLAPAACTTEQMEQVMPTAHEGEMLFAANCASCHDHRGTGGQLEGGQTAPDLTRITERNGGAFPRAEVLSQIDGYGRGKVSEEIMPEFGALLEGDLVPVEVDGVLTPTPRPLAALLAYLESIQMSG